MKPNFILTGLLFFIILCSINISHCQTNTTISASCGKCGRAVSSSSSVRDICPYCGVRWGGENTATSYSNRKSSSYVPKSSVKSINNENPFMFEGSMTTKGCNLMSSPSASSVKLCLIAKGKNITITNKKNGWVKVKYEGMDYTHYLRYLKAMDEYDKEYSKYESELRKLNNPFLFAPTKPDEEFSIPQTWVGWLRISDVVE